jgi:hypothetical protein
LIGAGVPPYTVFGENVAKENEHVNWEPSNEV